MQISVSELTVYPVKSLAGVAVARAALDRFGLSGDRRWLVVDSSGEFLTQRELPQMATIGAVQEAASLVLSQGGDSHVVAVPDAASPSLTVQVWMDTVVARSAGSEADAWLSERLERPCQLVYMPDDCRRLVDPGFASAGETVSFADGYPLLLIGAGSLAEFNTHLQQAVPMNRFRPNLVVAGAEPFAEDSWRRIRVGEVEFELVKPCSRCVMPSIDQATGSKDSEILRALAQHRRGPDRKTYFGQNLLYSSGGTLALGDPVTVLD